MKEKVRTDYSACCACTVCPFFFFFFFFQKVVTYKLRFIGFITEVARGFLYLKHIVRNSSGCTKTGTFFFVLWCDESRKMKK